MTEPTSGTDARAARLAAEAQLATAKLSRPEVGRITRSLERMLEPDIFSLRLAEALGLDDDRR